MDKGDLLKSFFDKICESPPMNPWPPSPLESAKDSGCESAASGTFVNLRVSLWCQFRVRAPEGPSHHKSEMADKTELQLDVLAHKAQEFWEDLAVEVSNIYLCFFYYRWVLLKPYSG